MSYSSKPNEIRHPQAAVLLEGYLCQRVQSLGYSADLNSEDVYQLTAEDVVEVVDAAPSVSVTIDINEFGSINPYNHIVGNYGAADNTNTSTGTVTHTELGEAIVDVVVPIKESMDATEQTRVLWFNNCTLESLSGSYQVDGFATESIALAGNGQRWFQNAWASARVAVGTDVSAASLVPAVNGADLTLSATVLPIMLIEDGIPLSSTYWARDGAVIDSAGGYSFKPSSRYRVVYLRTAAGAGTFPSFSVETGPVGGVKEGEIEISLWDSNDTTEPDFGFGANNKIMRVQSVDYECSFDREDLKQLNTGTYLKGLNSTSITSSISLYDSDLEMWAIATGNSDDYTSETNDFTTMTLSDFQNTTNLTIRIDVFNTKEYVDHDETTLLKSIYLTGGKVTTTGDTFDVPGRGTQSFDLKFTGLSFVGTGLSGR